MEKRESKIIRLLLIPVFALGLFFSISPAGARQGVTDWYIQDFDTEIIANKDSSLDITEKITADCGYGVDKHGIFRIVPEIININGEKIKTPVELLSITDFKGSPLKYTETRDSGYGTVTWKIGDPDKTVQGVSYYLIRYRIKNTIRFSNPDFDELYWNLTGNFWDLEIDNFHGKIIFPSEVNGNNGTLDIYAGSLNEKGTGGASYRWSSPNVLEIDYPKTLAMREGLTASTTFPKNIFVPYKPSFWEKYGNYFYFLIPLAAFIACFYFWWKYGKDPKVDKAIIPEYDTPGNLTPIEIGMLMSNGKFKNTFITAEMINLATKKLISIKEIEDKMLFFRSKDHELTRNQNPEAESALNSAQKAILSKVFEEGGSVKLSSLKNNFYKAVSDIKKKAENILEDKKLITASGMKFSTTFIAVGFLLFFFSFFAMSFSGYLGFSLIVSGVLVIIFSLIMPKRTMAGANLNWEIKGFKLFMETVDKDRAKFYEKENIFEKFLPYAIIFGITEIWIKKMKEIYGEDYYTHYSPAWYAGSVAAFDADSFSSAIDSLSSSIASNTSSPSGSGGGGGAGGGGGGGGGGGW